MDLNNQRLKRKPIIKMSKSKASTKSDNDPKTNKIIKTKRKADTELDNERRVKISKSWLFCDIFSMTEEDALNVNLFNGTSMDKTSTTTIDLNNNAVDTSSIEMNLRRLCALCKLTHSEFKSTVISKLSDIKVKKKAPVYEMKYQVSKIINLKYDQELKRPSFEIKWKGYKDDENTWEPIKNIWDCSVFQKFSDQFIRSRRTDMELLWNEMIEIIATESLEPNLNDREAIDRIETFNYNDFLAHFFMMVCMRRDKANRKSISYQTVYDFLLNDMKHLSYYIRRLNQIQNIHRFQQHINIVDQSKNLHVENVNDFESPPMNDFIYTNDVIPRDGIIIPDDPPIGCDCVEGGECSVKSNCCSKLNDAKFPYTKRGLIRVPQGTPIFECNKACKCSENCSNRVVQKGRKQALSIFKTKDRGWGVRAKKAIAKGQYICEYVGEIISHEETERRGVEYDAIGRTYLFDLDFNGKNNPYTVDAAKYGNVSRFINHSCDPNLGVWAVWTNCLDRDLHKLCLFSLKNIKENEELTFSYSSGANKDKVNTVDTMQADQNSDTDDLSTEIFIKSFQNDINKEDDIELSNNQIILATTKQKKIQMKRAKYNKVTSQSKDTAKVPETITNTKNEGFKCRCGAAKCRKVFFC